MLILLGLILSLCIFGHKKTIDQGPMAFYIMPSLTIRINREERNVKGLESP